MLKPERGQQILYLSRAQIEGLEFSMDDVIDAVDLAFREKAAGRVEMPPKPGIHTRPDAFIHAMPASLPGLGAAGMKWVSGYPDNARFGLPYITGLLILNCPETGLPLAVMDCSWITEKRTAASSAVAVRRLAEKPQRLAIIGAGVQGRANADALRRVCPSLRVVAAYDPSDAARGKFQEEVAAWGLAIEQAPSVEAAVRDADIVVTCAPIIKNPQPVIPAHWLKPGAIGVSLDFDATFQAATVQTAAGMWVDDAGQFEYYRQHGHFRDFPTRYEEVSQLVTGASGSSGPGKLHMVVNLGIALEDMATALPLYKRALERESGTMLPL